MLATVLERAASDAPDGAMRQFADSVRTLPSWLDWESLARGQEVFVRYAGAAEMSLLHLSLVGGFGAPKINKVLLATGYLANAQTYRRLFETNQMIVDCLAPGSMQPDVGRGWLACVRVRLLHTQVRQRLLKLDRWDRQAWGVPINQEDMMATLLSFHYNVLFAIERIGISLTQAELRDYALLWRYIGYVVGVDEAVNPCDLHEHAKATLESILMHLVEPDSTSEYLSHHVIRSLELRRPTNWSFAAHAEMSRMFMGDELADKLNLPPSRWDMRLFHNTTFLILRTVAVLSRLPGVRDVVLTVNLHGLQEITRLGLRSQSATFALTHAPSGDNLAQHEHAAHAKRLGGAGGPPGHAATSSDVSVTNEHDWRGSTSLIVRLFGFLSTPSLWNPLASTLFVAANVAVLVAAIVAVRRGALLSYLARLLRLRDSPRLVRAAAA